MKKRLILLSFLSIVFTKNEYPFFTDTKQQLKFEEKRIYLTESTGAISFDYGSQSTIEYTYDWKITRNNIDITELDFLKIVGLNEKRSSIMQNYRNTYSQYQEKLNEYKNKMTLKDEIIYKPVEFKRGTIGHLLNINYRQKKVWNWSLLGLFTPNADDKGFENMLAVTRWTLLALRAAVDVGYYETDCYNYGNDYGDCDKVDRLRKLRSNYSKAVSVTTMISVLNLIKWKKKVKKPFWKYPEYRLLKEPEVPPLNQTLSAEQTKSIAESYNRKVYEQIAND